MTKHDAEKSLARMDPETRLRAIMSMTKHGNLTIFDRLHKASLRAAMQRGRDAYAKLKAQARK